MRACAIAALFALLAGCHQTTITTVKEESKDEPVKQYALHGQVLRLDTQDKIAAIKHEAIGDWMGPMTMEFPVKDQSEFGKLREGEQINATVFVQGNNYWVGGIQEAAAPATSPAQASK